MCTDGVLNVMIECMTHLETYGSQTEGLFRIEGKVKRVKEMVDELHSTGNINLKLDKYNLIDISAFLRKIVNKFFDPLLPIECYRDIIHLGRDILSNGKSRILFLSLIEFIGSKMTFEQAKTFKALMIFLHNFAKYEENTKMGTRNLAIIFALDLVRRRSGFVSATHEDLIDIDPIQAFVDQCIENAQDEIFQETILRTISGHESP